MVSMREEATYLLSTPPYSSLREVLPPGQGRNVIESSMMRDASVLFEKAPRNGAFSGKRLVGSIS
jgi:hypothetical protein